MDFNQIISRAKNMILSPATEWEAIKTEAKPSKDVLINYVLPFVVLVAICQIAGSLVFHMSYFMLSVSLLSALISIIVPIAAIYISAWIITELAPSFGSRKNFDAAFSLVAYASTAAFVASAASGLLPLLGISMILSLFGLYSLYILYLGFTPIMGTPEDKKVVFYIISLVIYIAAMLVFSMVLGLILLGAGTGAALMR
jgi:hypothetical protein